MKQHNEAFLALVRDAKSRVRETDVHAVMQRLEAGEFMHLVDVREDHEWEKGHLPEAMHLGKGIIERDIEKQIADKNAPVVLYCGGGYRSALAADAIQKMGYSNVLSMDGGFSGWKESGYPVVTE